MSPSTLTAFWLVSFLFVLSPGMDWAYAIAAGTARHRILPAVGGMVLGHLAIILLLAAGLGTLLRHHPLILPALTSCGALYLLWLGISQLRTARAAFRSLSVQQGPALYWLGKGICISLFNPKVMMIIIAILPQFISTQARWTTGRQIIALGAIHCLTCLSVYLPVGHAARCLLSSRPGAARRVNLLSGCAMTAIALLMLGESTARHF